MHYRAILYSAMHYRAEVQLNSVQYSIVLYSAEPCNIVLYSVVVY